MSTPPEERLLDFALTRVFEEEARGGERVRGVDAVDLAPRVLSAWEQGESGPALDELGVTRPAEVRSTRTTGPRLGVWTSLAASLAVVLGATLFVRARSDREPRGEEPTELAGVPETVLLASVSRPVIPVTPGAPERVPTNAVPSGTWFRTDAGGVTRVTFGYGWVCDLSPGTEARWSSSGPSLELATGSLELPRQETSGTLVLQDFGTLEARTETALVLELVARKELQVEVSAGRAELAWGASGAMERNVLLAGDERRLGRDARSGTPIGLDDNERLERLFEWLTWAPYEKLWLVPGMDARMKRSEQALDELLAMLEVDPARWSTLAPLVEDASTRSSSGTLYRRRAIDLVSRAPGPVPYAFGRELWLRTPESFTMDHMIAFADRGAFEFARELRAMVALDDGTEPRSTLVAAVWCAFDGDPSGRDRLDRAVEESAFGPEDLTLTLAAVAGLERLGEADAWRRMRRALHATAVLELEAGATLAAARLVRAMTWFEDEGSVRPPLRLTAFLRTANVALAAVVEPDEADLRRSLAELGG